MIKLTMLRTYDQTESAIYVNPHNITYFNQVTHAVRQFGPLAKQAGESVELTYTIISFAAGLHEETDSINVIESPELIINMIRAEAVSR